MTDAEMIEAYKRDSSSMFTSDFSSALLEREKEIEVCTDMRLGELIQLALAIDCYYGPQASFLGQCAYEAGQRLWRVAQDRRFPL